MAMSSGLLVLAVLAVGVFAQRGTQPEFDETMPSCRGKEADIFFILDASSSIYIEDYELQRQFVREVINRLDISAQSTRVGALAFSDNYRISFNLGEFQTKEELRNAVNDRNVPYLTGLTNTAEAIRTVRTNSQFRADVTRVIIVVTDGYSRQPGATRNEADTARREGFYMFVIGVGQYTDEREWRAIANDPDNSFMYNITNYRGLDRLYSTIPNSICNLPPIILNSGTCNIRENADLIFVAGPSEADNAFSIVSNMVNALRDARGQLRLSLLLGSCRANEVPLSDPSLFCNNFGDPIPRQDSYSNLLKEMRAEARDARGARPQANQVAILFLDQQSMELGRFDILRQARDAQFDGIDIYLVDLGVRTNQNFLGSIASSTDNVLSTSGPGNLENILINKVCDTLNQVSNPLPTLPPS
ncbi:cartilage matrix protein-like [Haliotis rubra]|uniref:cartilage matrix protein-like n=1 Tax=Haliotis rubra TaxID=36100 RepID=UPI001EE5C480|nr:cartilage matrix protein-like [Haliotis rubra]